MTELDDLSGGRVVRLVGRVTARSRPTLRYVVSARGSFQAPIGVACWHSFDVPYSPPEFVSYPFPGQRLSIIQRTRTAIVIQAITTRLGYRELDYVDPTNHLEYRVVLYTKAHGATYRVVYRIASAPAVKLPATRACTG